MAANSYVKLHFFEGDDIVITNTAPFYMTDGGLNIGDIEITSVISPPNTYGIFFTNGLMYGTRELTIQMDIKDMGHTYVNQLYTQIGELNFLSPKIDYSRMAVELYYGDGTGGKVYQVFLRVLTAEIQSGNTLFTVERMHNESTLGQTITLRLICEPFFYRYNPLNHTEWPYLQLVTTDGSVNYTDGLVNKGNALHPAFYIVGTQILGDVPSPAVVLIDTTASGGTNIGQIYIGLKHVHTQPAFESSASASASGGDSTFPNAEDFVFGNGDDIPQYLSGKVFVLTSYVALTGDGEFTVGIQDNVGTTVDMLTGRAFNGSGNNGFIPLGTMNIPQPGRGLGKAGDFAVSLAGTATINYAVVIPAEEFRAYIPNRTGITLGNKELIDNPYFNTLYINDKVGAIEGAWYNTLGKPLLLPPSIPLKGAIFAFTATGGTTTFTNEFSFKIKYNPRYLYMRNVEGTP